MLDRRPIVPALSEGLEELRHRGAVDLCLHVVPWRPLAVASIQVLCLRIAEMLVAVAPAVTQVDPADKGQILVRLVGAMHEDQLLVMRAGAPDPLVQQELAARRIDDVGKFGLFLFVETHPGRMRAPQQAAHPYPSAGEPSRAGPSDRAPRR